MGALCEHLLDERVIRSKPRRQDRKDLSVEFLGLGVPSLRGVGVGHMLEGHRHVEVVGAEDPLEHTREAQIEGGGVVPPLPFPVEPGQASQRTGYSGVLRAVRRLDDGERTPIEDLGAPDDPRGRRTYSPMAVSKASVTPFTLIVDRNTMEPVRSLLPLGTSIGAGWIQTRQHQRLPVRLTRNGLGSGPVCNPVSVAEHLVPCMRRELDQDRAARQTEQLDADVDDRSRLHNGFAYSADRSAPEWRSTTAR